MTDDRQRITIESVNGGNLTFAPHSPIYTTSPEPARPVQPGHSTVLLVVAADVEFDAVADAFTATADGSLPRSHTALHTVFELGRIGRTDIRLVQIGQGTVTPDSAASMPQLIDALRPDHVVLVGICYGLREDATPPQQLGDLVIASELRLLGHHKLRPAGERQDRGGAPHPSTMLLGRFRSARVGWHGARIHVGPVVSESVLVNSPEYRRWIKETYVEAIAGEMEGAAVYAAAHLAKVDWALVKAICDWGQGKSDHYQRQAADNAAAFVLHAIRSGALDPVDA